jgi:hypothetical protein
MFQLKVRFVIEKKTMLLRKKKKKNSESETSCEESDNTSNAGQPQGQKKIKDQI